MPPPAPHIDRLVDATSSPCYEDANVNFPDPSPIEVRGEHSLQQEEGWGRGCLENDKGPRKRAACSAVHMLSDPRIHLTINPKHIFTYARARDTFFLCAIIGLRPPAHNSNGSIS